VTNNSSATCAAETIGLSAVAPSGWSRLLGQSAFSLAPGQQGQTSLNVGVPTGAASGPTSVAVSASSGTTSLGSSTAATVNVVAPEVRRLSFSVLGQGTVAISPVPSLGGGIQYCRLTCNVDYADAHAGAEVTLTVKVNDPSTFAGWGGACSGTSLTCKVTMSADRNVTASFKPSGS
jgi:uncharacterized repeat protein (TIGR02543 family)